MMNTYTLTVSEKEMQIIAAGLGELPAKISVDLIIRLRREVAEQSKPKKRRRGGAQKP